MLLTFVSPLRQDGKSVIQDRVLVDQDQGLTPVSTQCYGRAW